MHPQENKLSTAEEGPYILPCEIVVTVSQSSTGADQDINDSFLFEEGPSLPDELVTGIYIP